MILSKASDLGLGSSQVRENCTFFRTCKLIKRSTFKIYISENDAKNLNAELEFADKKLMQGLETSSRFLRFNGPVRPAHSVKAQAV